MTLHEANVFNVAQTDVLPLFEGKAKRKVNCFEIVEGQIVAYTVSTCAFFCLTSSSRSLISMTRFVQSLRAFRLIRYKAMRLDFNASRVR